MLLIDKIMASHTKSDLPERDGIVNDYLKQSQATIKIDNVADYYFRQTQDTWDITTDFPNLAPPFETFWMEYRMPPTFTTEGKTGTTPWQLRGAEIGLLIQGLEIPETIKGTDFYNGETSCQWSLLIAPFWNKGRRLFMGGDVTMEIGIKSDGSVGLFGDRLAFRYISNNNGIAPFADKGLPVEAFREWYAMFAHPALLAISFMHCKNVEMVENKFASKRRRNKGQPITKFYTLKIDPMKRILRTAGNCETTGLKNALHICRGHFKDYRERGLFGKYKGVYWWDSQVRGNADSGITDKDYEVDANGD